jgi:hypothetical protein
VIPVRIPEAQLQKALHKTKRRDADALTKDDEHRFNLEDVAMKQELYLHMFNKTFSPALARRHANVNYETVKRWRDGWYEFGVAYNNIIDEWAEEVHAGMMMAARYRLIKDEETESGFQESAEGVPIVVIPNEKMAAAICRAHVKGFGEKFEPEGEGKVRRPLVVKAAPVEDKQSA